MSHEIERLIERARMQIAHQNLFGAVESLRQALTIDVDNAEAHALLALCLHDQKRLHAAEYEARAALALSPESWFAHYAVGLIEAGRRRFKSAEEHLQTGLALSPDNTALLRSLARLYFLWDRKAEAIATLEKAREVDPDDADTWATLGEHYRDARQFDRAMQCTRQALEIDPENADALVTMGYLLLQRGDTEDAREHALGVLRHNASHEGAIHLLTAVKARRSLVLGLWWRCNSALGGGSMTRRVLLLLGMYLVYRTAIIAADDLGHAAAAAPLNIVWLAFCVYSWVGPAIFMRQIRKELAPAALNSRY